MRGHKVSKNIADQMFPDPSEQELEELVTSVPPKDRRLITSAVDFAVSTLVEYVRDSTIRIPEFQRHYVWSQIKASRLIESLIMQCPVPVVYFSRTADGLLEVVDGNQRLTSIRRYIDGHFELKGLTAFPELSNLAYAQLDLRFQRHIQSRTIRCVVIEPESHPQIKFDVFERLNSGSTPLNPQELRHGIYSGALMKLLGKLSGSKPFVKTTGIKNDTRMKRDELVLRALAFSEAWEGYEKPLGNFLNLYCQQNRGMPDERAVVLSGAFNSAIIAADILLGPSPYRFAGPGEKVPKFNTAYFDSVVVGLMLSGLKDLPANELVARLPQVRSAVTQLSQQQDFVNSVSRATSDEAAVKSRIRQMRDVFDAAL
jgi:hypothetical protein